MSDTKKIRSLIKLALSNRVEYLKVDGLEIKFSPLAFVDSFEQSVSKSRKKSNDNEMGILPSIKRDVQMNDSNSDSSNEDISSFDPDLLYYSAGD